MPGMGESVVAVNRFLDQGHQPELQRGSEPLQQGRFCLLSARLCPASSPPGESHPAQEDLPRPRSSPSLHSDAHLEYTAITRVRYD